MRLLVVDQCSNAKDAPDEFEPLSADEIDATSLTELREEAETPVIPARDLYAGRQQRYISEAVNRLRNAGDDIDRVFISAGFGVVDERELLPPYNVTFNDLTADELDARADLLDIETEIRALLEDDYDLIVFALGADYYRSLNLSRVLDSIALDQLVLLFNREEDASNHENVLSLPARTAEAKEYGTIVVALKGLYLKNFAEHRAHGDVVTGLDDLKAYCTTEYTTQTGLEWF